MNKILSLLIVTGLIVGIGVTYAMKTLIQNPKQEQVNVNDKIAEKKMESDLENQDTSQVLRKATADEQVTEKNEQVSIGVEQAKPKISSGTKKQENLKEEIPKVEQKEQTTSTAEKKAATPKQEIIEKPEVDEEYERLKKQVEYATYEECMTAGFEIALKDTVNILGFSCPYVVYKGKILGYRLQLDYTNPMDN